MPAQSTHRAPLESKRKKPIGRTQRGGAMVLRSGIKTGSNRVEKKKHTAVKAQVLFTVFMCLF